jgi:hypothetical protein
MGKFARMTQVLALAARRHDEPRIADGSSVCGISKN